VETSLTAAMLLVLITERTELSSNDELSEQPNAIALDYILSVLVMANSHHCCCRLLLVGPQKVEPELAQDRVSVVSWRGQPSQLCTSQWWCCAVPSETWDCARPVGLLL
jgi:hypothetical protein